MRPQDTVHLRTMLHDSMDEELMHAFFDYWINRDAGARYAFPSRRIHGHEVPWAGSEVCNDIQMTTKMAESWYVGGDVMNIVDAMRLKMPPEVMHQEDPPSTHGFLVFENPWMQADVHGKAMPIRAILWSTREVGKRQYNTPANGLAIWTLSDIDDRFLDDYFRPENDDDKMDNALRYLYQRGCRFSPTGIFAVTFGAYAFTLADRVGTWVLAHDNENIHMTETKDPGVWDVEMLINDASNLPDQVLSLNPEAARAFGFTRDHGAYGKDLGAAQMPRHHRVSTEPIIGFLQALWRFQEQELTAIERPHLRSTLRRQLQRRQMLDSPISVIHWRKRAQSEEHGTREFEYSHRFVVRGHWRRQWYPSEQRHKSIYIRPFLKGPENAPILMRERVNAVVR